MLKRLLLGFLAVSALLGCDKDFCSDYPESPLCTSATDSDSTVSVISCPDTGRAGYFPLVVNALWTYNVIEGTGRDTSKDSITSPTGNTWSEDVRMVDDSTWVTYYSGGPYDGQEDTVYVFLQNDTLYMRINRTIKLITDTVLLRIEAPFAWYPLKSGDSVSTDWDTLPPADYIGDTAADTIRYRLIAVVKDTTTLEVNSQPVCSQEVVYTIVLELVGGAGSVYLSSHYWWTPYTGVVKRIERDPKDTTMTKWLQKDLLNFTLP